MPKYRRGELHSGSKSGPVVKNPAQAKAIQLSEARDEGYSIPKKSGAKKGRKRGSKR
jgi:hypothetical protein